MEKPIASKTAVLIVNLGSPSSPTPRALRKYLWEFLSDRRVVEIPRWLWWPMLCIILWFRGRYSARLYQKIWTSQGSPLLVISKAQRSGLEALLNQLGTSMDVALAMRYGFPSIKQALLPWRDSLDKLIVLPLYPQYASATVGSIFNAVTAQLSSWRVVPELHIVTSYASHPGYITALVNSIRHYWQKHPPGQHLLISFHGLPQRQVDAGDPYYQQCCQTAQLIVQTLNYPAEKWSLVFQSRFGRAKWLQPYLDPTLQQLAHSGIKVVDVVCPGFAADCLETLEEINHRSREVFLAAGGEQLNYIPALNDSPEHLAVLADLVRKI